MDVAEAEGKFVIMVEVPGVNVGDIRVEVDDQK
jgi:HSP20 family protein